jgi:death on curing protein
LESLSGPLELLTAEDIININASIIKSFGGFLVSNPNLRPDGPGLDYLLACITYPLGDVDLFPTIIDKAAFTAQYIITRHPFHDTNKRTGMESAMEMLQLNGFVTLFQSSEVTKMALDVEAGIADIDQLRIWFLKNIDFNAISTQ